MYFVLTIGGVDVFDHTFSRRAVKVGCFGVSHGAYYCRCEG